jgi:hypothetical protein
MNTSVNSTTVHQRNCKWYLSDSFQVSYRKQFVCVHNSNKEILKHFEDITILKTTEERVINNTKQQVVK